MERKDVAPQSTIWNVFYLSNVRVRVGAPHIKQVCVQRSKRFRLGGSDDIGASIRL